MKKFDTIVVSAKLFCVFAGTSLLTLQTGLGQWSNAETNPSVVQWVMIIGGSLGTGLTATGAFLSNAFGTYVTGLNGNGHVPLIPTFASPTGSVNILLTDASKPATLGT